MTRSITPLLTALLLGGTAATTSSATARSATAFSATTLVADAAASAEPGESLVLASTTIVVADTAAPAEPDEAPVPAATTIDVAASSEAPEADSPAATSSSAVPAATDSSADAFDAPGAFLSLLTRGATDPFATIVEIGNHWTPSLVPMAIETLRLDWSSPTRPTLLALLGERTGERFGGDIDRWWRDVWSRPEVRHPHYADFKSRLYRNIDPLFGGYFDDARATDIRLDEVRWGGVRQDGIPPLRYPAMLTAEAADYLADGDVVFGIAIDGDARAYPKRILAWHEMFVDTIGGVEIAGVYCTLCGAVIPYETNHDGTRHELGTSGFLYRSNKLMYDRATQSLWSTTRGEPVIGPLVGEGIALARRAVVTTTWGEWRRRHPDTTVLDIDTGHRRDYGEGVAYRDYFATDELMFTVPSLDERLDNKAEILALRTTTANADDAETLAIHADFLATRPVHHDTLGGERIVVLTDTSGANRAYRADDVTFASYDGGARATDAEGGTWTLDEGAVTGENGTRLERLPAHRAFWFGWVAVHADTRLVR